MVWIDTHQPQFKISYSVITHESESESESESEIVYSANVQGIHW